MIRTIKVAKDVAVKARTSAMISLKSILVNAPTALREQLQPLSKMALIHRCAGLRPGEISTVEAAAKHALRSIARRWERLNDEITAHEKVLAGPSKQRILAVATLEEVVAFAIGENIVARTADNRIIASTTFEDIVAVITPERVVASAGLHLVLLRRTAHHDVVVSAET